MTDESPLISGARQMYQGFNRLMDKIPPRSKPKYDDTHARLVREANESFRKRKQKKTSKRK